MERSGVDMDRELQEFQERRRRRQQRRKQRLITTAVVTVLALLLLGLTAYLTYHRGMRNLGLTSLRQPVPSGQSAASATAPPAAEETGRINVLLFGTDEEIDQVGRTDTIMLVSLDPRSGDAGVLSIPRDTRVEIPGRGFQRINAANALGGPQLLVRTVEQLLGVPVHYYVAVNFTGFVRFIDALGGIEVDIPRPMKYDDYAQGLHIDLPAGRQVLNGQQALHYVRYRGDGLGDVALVDPARGTYDGRVRRQLEFAELVARKVFSVSTLPRLPQLVQELFGMVRTDISLDRALALVVSARNFDVSRLQTAVLPGTAGTVNGASYWLHDAAKTRVVVDRVIRGLDVLTVEVLNGSGRSGAATAAADWLRSHGFDVVRVGNAPAGFAYERTQIIVNRDGVDAKALADLVGSRVAGASHDGEPGVLVVQATPVLRDPALVNAGDSAAGRGMAGAAPAGTTAAASAGTVAGGASGPDVTIVLGLDFQG